MLYISIFFFIDVYIYDFLLSVNKLNHIDSLNTYSFKLSFPKVKKLYYAAELGKNQRGKSFSWRIFHWKKYRQDHFSFYNR